MAPTGEAAGLDDEHRIPDRVDRATVAALGTLSEALETTERARGYLYGFHQLTGAADFELGEAVAQLRAAGHTQLAQQIDQQLVGRNVIAGRWTFQLIEEYDENYWQLFRSLERQAREQLVAGRRHLHEAALKEERRTAGSPGHEATPG